jgi:hypothetical protein
MYEIVEFPGFPEPTKSIMRTDDDGTVWSIPEDPENSDYQQYLVDTDGGLPTPKEGK